VEVATGDKVALNARREGEVIAEQWGTLPSFLPRDLSPLFDRLWYRDCRVTFSDRLARKAWRR
jgi:hypothetical protein